MSVSVMSWVLDHSTATGNDRLVLIAIADEADADGTNAYPSVDRISKRARVNKRTTLRAIERLEASGELVVVRPEVRGRGRFNVYRVVMRNGDIVSPNIPTQIGLLDPGMVHNGDTLGALDPLTQEQEPSSSEPAARREDVERLCSLLADSIAERGARKPTITDAWRKQARLLLDKDEVTLAEAERVLRWATRDEFWSSNILSIPKFREKFDQLKLKSGVTPIRQARQISSRDEWAFG